MTTTQRWSGFLLVTVVIATAGVLVLRRTSGPAPPTVGAAVAPPSAPRPAPPLVALRDLRPGGSWGRLILAPVDQPDAGRFIAPLTCDRVHLAGGRGLCLQADGVAGTALAFDDTFAVRHRWPLTGPPSRARVSADGRLGAFTVFEQGHSYADHTFSTRTTIVDLERGEAFPDLESFVIWQGSTAVRRIDVNYWGVTFVPGTRRFYATLAYGDTPHLVEGDLDRREVRVRADHVECPSLSPDGTRLAFKRADGLRWRLWVMDLATTTAHQIAGETRSVDDQVEWLDAAHVLYAFPSDEGNIVWAAEVDGTAPARPFAREAWSPAVVR